MLGYVAARDPERAATIRAWRGLTGAIPGPFEVWLAHRSLATLAVRLERQEANAAALADAAARPPDRDRRALARASAPCRRSRWPDAGTAGRFLAAAPLVTEATSFGGVHTSAERRGRWGTDDVAEGLVRFNAGIEDRDDLVADLRTTLDALTEAN